ncbi:MAG: hypothetical protein QXI60_11250 [Thermofilaceae archaeon]
MLFVSLPPFYVVVPATIIYVVLYLKLGAWLAELEDVEGFDYV